MARLPDRQDLIEITFRSLNSEYYLHLPESREFLDKLDLKQFEGIDWTEHNVNEPRFGDLYPGFVRATVRIFFEKMGWKIKKVEDDIKVAPQPDKGKDVYVVYLYFVGKNKYGK